MDSRFVDLKITGLSSYTALKFVNIERIIISQVREVSNSFIEEFMWTLICEGVWEAVGS